MININKLIKIVALCLLFLPTVFSCGRPLSDLSDSPNLTTDGAAVDRAQIKAYDNTRGFRDPNLQAQYLNRSYLLTTPAEQPSPEDISRYVATTRLQNSHQSVTSIPERIGELIIRIANCFSIDAFIFAGLIRQESSFFSGQAHPHKAAGLTQFTYHGISEVNAQLGLAPFLGNLNREITYTDSAGVSESRTVFPGIKPATIAYFNDTIKSCIAVDFDWVSPDQRVMASIAAQNKALGSAFRTWSRNDLFFEYKKVLVDHIETSLIYGAIMLKTLLIQNTEAGVNTGQLYQISLRSYNNNKTERTFEGVTRQERDHYWRRILFEHVSTITTEERPTGLRVHSDTFEPAIKPINCNKIACDQMYQLTIDSVLNVRASAPVGKTYGKLCQYSDHPENPQELVDKNYQLTTGQIFFLLERNKNWGRIALYDTATPHLDCAEQWIWLNKIRPLAESERELFPPQNSDS